MRKVHKSLEGVTVATENGVKDYIPKSFNNVKVYSGVKYQNYNPADVEIRNFYACQGDSFFSKKFFLVLFNPRSPASRP